MKLHLVDATYELFRAFYGRPGSTAPDGREVGATHGLIRTLLVLLRQDGVTHVACAFDHTIESFRNRLFDGYKSGAGVPESLLSQFELAERAAAALGLVVWPMVEFEADDALATATRRWENDPRVDQVVICSPDKDLRQLVRGDAVVCLDRRSDIVLNEAGVRRKMGVAPTSVPDYLALVGDSADGIPGIPRWGHTSTGAVLSRYSDIETIPDDAEEWDIELRGARSLAQSLAERRAEALFYRKLATLREDVPLAESIDDLEWRGARRSAYVDLCLELGSRSLAEAPHRWADS